MVSVGLVVAEPSATAKPPVAAAVVNVTVHCDVAPGPPVTAVGVQTSADNAGAGGGAVTVTVPPVAVIAMAPPAGDAPIGLDTVILLVAEAVTVTVATTPLPI